MKNKALARDSYKYIDGVAKESESSPGKLLRLLQSAFSMDLISGALLASGLGAALLTLTDIESGFFSSLCFAFAATLMISAFSLKWWLAPASAAAFTAALGLYLGLTGGLESASSYWAGFVGWVGKGAHYDKAYSENGGAEILQFMVLFVVALVCFVFIRKLFSLPLIFLMASTGFGFIYYLGRADLTVPVCAVSAGMIVLLPRVYSRYVSRHSTSVENRGAMQIVAVPAALLAILFSMWLVPEDTSSWKSRGLNDFIADVAYLFAGPFRSYPSSASDFSMKRLGFEQENGLLGGPVRLTNERFLSVTSERPVLLRGAVRDFYTGKEWQIGGADGDFRLEGLFWQSYRRSAFGLGQPPGREAKKLFESLTAEQEFTVNYRSGKFSTFFAGGILSEAEFAKNTIVEPIHFNMRSELYLYYLIPRGARAHIKTRVWNTEMPGFEDGFLLLESLAANRGDRNFSQISQRYTKLPDTLPENIFSLAKGITAESESPYQKAKAIEKWLRENCKYTLEPVVPPENEDFVGHFMDTREGYCTYYASAMAVLARCVGLPSRYVTGFGLEREAGTEALYLATGETAHAWAEIYFDGIGWVEFDPLNWNPVEPLNSERAELPDSQPQPARPPQISGTEDEHDENTEHNAAIRNAVSLRQAVSFLAASAAGCLTLYFAVRRVMGRKLRVYELTRVSRKIPDLGKRIDFYFDDIWRQLSLLGIKPDKGETLTDFSVRADQRVRLNGISFADIAKTRMRLHFANAAPTDADCEDAYRYHHELELLVRERLRKTEYFFKRALS